MISAILGIAKNALGLGEAAIKKSKQKEELNNSPEVVAAKESANLQEEKEAGITAVKNEDIETIRKRWAD